MHAVQTPPSLPDSGVRNSVAQKENSGSCGDRTHDLGLIRPSLVPTELMNLCWELLGVLTYLKYTATQSFAASSVFSHLFTQQQHGIEQLLFLQLIILYNASAAPSGDDCVGPLIVPGWPSPADWRWRGGDDSTGSSTASSSPRNARLANTLSMRHLPGLGFR